MERNPLVGFNNGLKISYSDLKRRKNGASYITLYFEQPDSKRKAVKSAQINYPGGEFENVVEFRPTEINCLLKHVAKVGPLALSFAFEDE